MKETIYAIPLDTTDIEEAKSQLHSALTEKDMEKV